MIILDFFQLIYLGLKILLVFVFFAILSGEITNLYYILFSND